MEAPVTMPSFPVLDQVLGLSGSLVFGQEGMTLPAGAILQWTSGMVYFMGVASDRLSEAGDSSLPFVLEEVSTLLHSFSSGEPMGGVTKPIHENPLSSSGFVVDNLAHAPGSP